MKSPKAFFRMTIAAVLALSLLAGCSGNDTSQAPSTSEPSSNFNPTGLPIVKEPITIKMIAGKAPTTAPEWSQTMLWQEYEKMTNIKV